MQYMFLIYGEESAQRDAGDTINEDIHKGYMALSEELVSKGAMVSGAALAGVATATTVRVKNDKTLTTDGPFAETKEQLGGYFVLECADLDEAIAWAATFPTATLAGGAIEIRPLLQT